jgi:hypothetical protein
MGHKFFCNSNYDDALYIVGLDPEKLPDYLQNIGAFLCKLNGTEVVFVPDSWYEQYFGDACRAGTVLKYRMPTGWKRVPTICRNLACAVGIVGSKGCPGCKSPTKGFQSMVAGVGMDRGDREIIAEYLRADGFRQFNHVVLCRGFYGSFEDEHWAADAAQGTVTGDNDMKATLDDFLPGEMTLDFDELVRLEALVLQHVKTIQSGEAHDEWAPNETQDW